MDCLMTPDQLAEIEGRWAPRPDRDAYAYTDEGLRVIAETAYRDIPVLVNELRRQARVIDAYRMATIISREFDEDDDEPLEAWRSAYLVHDEFDPGFAAALTGEGEG